MRIRVVLVSVCCLGLGVFGAGCGDDDSGGGGGGAAATTVGVTPTTTFAPPLPQTTPNVSQPPDSLLDGTHPAFLVEIDVEERSIVFDLFQWFDRDDFDQAIADGRLDADDPCVELDFCIVNTNERTRTMNVVADARVSVVDWDNCCRSLRTDDLADAFARLLEGRDVFLLTASGGELTALDEIYLP